jgi:TPR repeat protein
MPLMAADGARSHAMGMEITRGSPIRSGAQVSTRSTIIAAARRLLNREGAGNVSFESVAAEAGVPLETVSVHFKDKQDLLIGLAADDMSSLASAMREEGPAENEDRPAARIIEHVAKPDERVMARLERRMQMLERAFADVVERHESSRAPAAPANGNDFASPDSLEGRDMTEDQNGTELPPVMAAPDAEVHEEHAPAVEDDLPPMIAAPPMVAAEQAEPEVELPPMRMGAKAEPARATVPSRDYLAAARRAASAAQSDMSSKGKPKANVAAPAAKTGSSRLRVLVYGCAAPLVILAASVMVLNRNTVTAETTTAPTPVVEPATPSTPVQAPAAEPRQQQAAAEQPVVPANPPQAQPDVVQQPGNGVPIEVLVQSAQLGDAKAERDLGLRYLLGNGIDISESEAARWLMQSAYQGDATAEYWLGSLYAGGKGVPADAFQAKHWYEAAAKKGNVKAMHNLALAQFQGQGMPKDTPSAVLWFTKAAEYGLRPSQYNLGNLYEQGNGVSRNLVEAYKWYSVAAAHGDKDADVRLTAVSGQLKPDELSQAKQLVSSFKPMTQDPSAN